MQGLSGDWGLEQTQGGCSMVKENWQKLVLELGGTILPLQREIHFRNRFPKKNLAKGFISKKRKNSKIKIGFNWNQVSSFAFFLNKLITHQQSSFITT